MTVMESTICDYCGKNVEDINNCIKIRNCVKEKVDDGKAFMNYDKTIYFHHECFYEMAGEEYKEKLKPDKNHITLDYLPYGKDYFIDTTQHAQFVYAPYVPMITTEAIMKDIESYSAEPPKPLSVFNKVTNYILALFNKK